VCRSASWRAVRFESSTLPKGVRSWRRCGRNYHWRARPASSPTMDVWFRGRRRCICGLLFRVPGSSGAIRHRHDFLLGGLCRDRARHHVLGLQGSSTAFYRPTHRRVDSRTESRRVSRRLGKLTAEIRRSSRLNAKPDQNHWSGLAHITHAATSARCGGSPHAGDRANRLGLPACCQFEHDPCGYADTATP
jgi:hypothetical protein